MCQKTTYFCDNCNKETNKTDLLKIPLGDELKKEFKELELCPTCHKKYKQIWTQIWTEVALLFCYVNILLYLISKWLN